MNIDRLALSRRGALAALAGAMLAGKADAQSPDTRPAGLKGPPSQPAPEALTPPAATSIEVHARPLASFDLRDRSHVRFGALEFRSGVQLTSSFSGFGGLSALRIDADGIGLVALTDKGSWLTGRIVYNDRDIAGLRDVKMAPMIGSDGRPLASRGWFDTESLACDGGVCFVGIERVDQLVRFDFGRDGVRARGQAVPLPPHLRKMPFNKGLETLVMVRKGLPLAGALIAISESFLDGDGNIVGAVIGGPKPGAFSVKRRNGFDVSDGCLLPAGELLLLERKFSWLGGIRAQIRRIALATLVPGAVLDGPVIFEADMGTEIDNLEGIDAHVAADGETVLTLVSDDNFSMLQRTLLLQFTLAE